MLIQLTTRTLLTLNNSAKNFDFDRAWNLNLNY